MGTWCGAGHGAGCSPWAPGASEAMGGPTCTARSQLRLPGSPPHTRPVETAPGLIVPRHPWTSTRACCPPGAPGAAPAPRLDVNSVLPYRHSVPP